MKSYYVLKDEERKKLDLEFRNISGGREAHQIWIFNNLIGGGLSVFSTLFLFFSLEFDRAFSSFQLLAVCAIFLGFFIVYSATKEYYQKFNSWLRVKKKIVRD